jgi:hypothetical protein
MFIINTPEGPIDIDDPEVKQKCYNAMMNKEKDMYQLEVDFIMLNKQFSELKDVKAWAKIAFSAGAEIVAIFHNNKLVTAIGAPS